MALNTAITPCKNKKVTDVTVVEGDEDLDAFEGPIKDRQCRDIVFLVLFAACIGGMGFVTWRAAALGNPLRLIYGTDSWGNVCNLFNSKITGVDLSGRNNVGKQHLYYFNDEVFSAVVSTTTGTVSSARLCVKTCPSTINSVTDMQTFATSTESKLCRYDVDVSAYHDGQSDGLGSCPPLPIVQHEVFLLRCVPTSIVKKVDHLFDAVNSLFNILDDNLLEKAASDVQHSWKEILWLCGLAVAVGLAVVVLLQFLAKIIIWLMVIGMIVGSIVATGVCWYHYYEARTTYEALPAENRTTQLEKRVQDWLIGSICVTVFTVIVLLILFALRKHIMLVVQLFTEAGKAVRSMLTLLVIPFLTLFWLALSFGVLGFIFLYIETAGNPEVDGTTGFVTYEADTALKVLKWYYILISLWIFQFIIACHKLTIAGAVAIWYFTRDKSTLSFPILVSVGRLIRYHLGSLAFGSLIVAIVQFVRMVLSFVENRLKGRTHPMATFLLKCFQCCLWCFEKFLKFLNNNAYIEIAIFGYGFCKAARQAFLIIVNNALRLAAINSVGDFVLFLGKVATVAIVVIVGIEIISIKDNINYTWLPTALAGVFAFFIASCFMSVYEMTIDTIFICFCEDSSINDGDRKPYFMSVGLRNCLSSSVRKRLRQVGPSSRSSVNSHK